jgi:hypothetical protein
VNATEATPSKNGEVRRIAKMGLIPVAFHDLPAFVVDIVALHDEWLVIDKSFRNEKDEVPPENALAYSGAKVQFVQSICQKGYAQTQQEAPVLSHAECFHFIAIMFEEVEKLRPFFVPKLRELPSSPENTEVRFSQ